MTGPAEHGPEGGERRAEDALEGGPSLRTGLGAATEERITLAGFDLAEELMGGIDLGDLAFLVVAKRRPSPKEARLFNAVLVGLCDHGLTPAAITARLTWLGAPGNVQGAIAAGLLGAGSRFLGTVEDTARLLQERLAHPDQAGSPAETPGGAEAPGGQQHPTPPDPAEAPDGERLAALAREVVADADARGERLPGLGHPLHKRGDPRTARVYALAEESGLLGPHLRLLDALAGEVWRRHGKALPVNGAGAGGAALSDLGFHWSVVRGFAVAARAVGLVGHLWEEQQAPMGQDIWDLVEGAAVHDAPAGAGDSPPRDSPSRDSPPHDEEGYHD